MFVNNGQLGRKYLSPERLRTAGIANPPPLEPLSPKPFTPP
jgi:hypothetical protein